MSLGDFLFGGTDNSQQVNQANINRENTALATEQANLAREDVLSLFGPAQRNLVAGSDSAMNYLQDAEPRRMNAMQSGMSQARQAHMSGLDQIQNAILGKPVDMSALQTFGSPLQIDPRVRAEVPDFVFADQVELAEPEVGGPQSMAMAGLAPHKGHYHDASGAKIMPDQVNAYLSRQGGGQINGFGGGYGGEY